MVSDKKKATAKQPSFATYLAVAIIAATAGFAAVYVNYSLSGNGAPPATSGAPKAAAPAARPGRTNAAGLAALARGTMITFVARETPADLPPFTVNDESGAARTLADWKGKVVLLNLWATWCGPCRKEMPSLDRLQAALGGEDFEVVAASIDKSDPSKPRAFLDKIGVGNLKFYHDPTAKLGITLKAYGMPTTLLIGRDGREIGRLVGPAEWDSKDALALLRAAIGEKS